MTSMSIRYRCRSNPWVIVGGNHVMLTETENGYACMLFNSQEMAELGIANMRPKRTDAAAIQVNLETLAPDLIASGCLYATIDFYGQRKMAVLDLREAIEAMARITGDSSP